MASTPRAKSPEMESSRETLLAELDTHRPLRDALEWFRRERTGITDTHLEICRIAAPTFLEQKRAEWMVIQFRSIGLDAKIDRAGNVVARFEGRAQHPSIAVTAHLDTVLAPRSAEEIWIDGESRMRGPGVSDNGAGLSALLALARYLAESALPFPVVFIANVGEEGEGNLSGMRHLCRHAPSSNRIAAFLVLDGPAVDHVTCQALASRRFEIRFSGAGGHSWSDFGAGNPVHALSRAIAHFLEARRAAPPGHPRVSFNFGLIEGGSSINSIPVEARSKVDIRSEDPLRLDELALELSNAVERSMREENEAATSRVTARVREIGSRPGGALAEDAPLLSAIRAVDEHLGIRSRLDCASTDANIPLSLGIPAISIGAGGMGGGAHTMAEWFHPEGRERGLYRILLTLAILSRQLQ